VGRYQAWNDYYGIGSKPKPKPKPAAKPAVKAVSPLQKLLNELSQGPIQRSDAQWASVLDPRVKPFTDAIDAATLNNRARSEFQFENAARANKDQGAAFLGILTGGKTGAEAEAYSKENFGGSYLGGQAMEIAAQTLRGLTADWDEREWAISGDYLKAMQEIPGIREELRASIEKDDVDDYTRKFQYTTLLLDETYRQSQLAEEKRQFNTSSAETKRVNDAQLGMAAQELGIDSYKAQTSRVNAATSAKNAAARAAQVELNRAREARQGLKDKASIRQADERIRIAKEKLRLQKVKDSGKGSAAQKVETDLALDILRDRDEILGKPGKYPTSPRIGAMSYTEAYEYVYGLAEAGMPNRQPPYINKWVKARLKALGLGKVDPKPRRG
jgi:IS5 family transposase